MVTDDARRYFNSLQECEECGCRVFAQYIPLCKNCFHIVMSKHGGLLKSRDGLWYRFTGQWWELDKALNRARVR